MKNPEEPEKKRKLVEDESDVVLSLRICRPRPTRAAELTPFHSSLLSQPIPPPQPKLSATVFLTETPPPPPPPFQIPSPTSTAHPPFVPPPQAPTNPPQDVPASSSLRPPAARTRRTPTQGPRKGKSDTVPAPFTWATDRRAAVHKLSYLLQNQIFRVEGKVRCKRCEEEFPMAFDVKEKFAEIWSFFAQNKSSMHDRAPDDWLNPTLPTCEKCGQENSARPVIAEKKREINWLFLLLGQLLGCCTLDQLKYFCKHNKIHRTGAKDRVLYLTYLELCRQLDPNGPFDR